jgi:Tfp pilus assembly protein PilP
MIKQTYKLFSLLGIIILLSACNKHDLSDLEVYIANIRTINHSSIKPISAYEPIQHYFYNATKNRDPFIPLKSLMAKSKPKAKPKLIKPKRAIPVRVKKLKKCRRNSKIDYTGIKHLKMVGTLQMGKHKWGLVESNGIVLRVKRNDYIAKAKIIRITKNHIKFLRNVPDGKGCWKKVYEKIFINSNY